MKRLLILLVAVRLFAGIPSSTTWEVRASGSDTNGGGFDTSKSGTDYSQNNSANSSGCSNCGSSSANLSTTCTTTITGGFTTTCAAASFTTAITGNMVYLVGGTGGTVTAGWYEATYASSTTITLDRSPGAAATLVTMNVGGALASPGAACSVATGQNIIWIGGGTYTLASGTANVATGTCKQAGASGNNTRSRMFGYHTSRWTASTGPTSDDFANRPVIINASFTGISVIDTTNGYVWLENVIVDCNSQTTCTAVNANGASTATIRVLARNFTVYGIEAQGTLFLSEVTGGTSCTEAIYAVGTLLASHVVSHGNGCPGFYSAVANVVITYSIAYGNTGAGFQSSTSDDISFINCTSFGNTSDGFVWGSGGYKALCVNCLSYGDGTSSGYGFHGSTSSAQSVFLINSAAGGEGTSNTNGINYQENFVSLSANPFVSSSGGNFALNTTAGGGSSLKAAGFPGVMPPGTTTGYADIGAIQHPDPSGGATASGAPIQ